ncbi:hypothetical protein GUJ93_ZPchr0013g37785 [Zizania palustris]|uniref:Uncharacterized protein n=1 Tax=Zizania palustris TaxID=103762 RepID=A0A8J5X381_ZIZPA|nr:hypothetical protein GUJ93_ZPchr0013g37785 [Zizania palustris]
MAIRSLSGCSRLPSGVCGTRQKNSFEEVDGDDSAEQLGAHPFHSARHCERRHGRGERRYGGTYVTSIPVWLGSTVPSPPPPLFCYLLAITCQNLEYAMFSPRSSPSPPFTVVANCSANIPATNADTGGGYRNGATTSSSRSRAAARTDNVGRLASCNNRKSAMCCS